MTDCERLSDRMPEVALHRAAWTGEEAAHLAGCAECRAEWELVLAARRLGERAPSVNVEAVAVGVHQRLAAERTAGRRTRWVWAAAASVAAAAAIALAVGTDGPARRAPASVAAAEPLVPLPELDGLETAQLDTLLDAVESPLAGTAAPELSAPGDDADAELDRILATWEG
jgi:hypothetical protein